MTTENEIIMAPDVPDGFARVNVTFANTNADLPDPVRADTRREDVLSLVQEAIRGGFAGMAAHPEADLEGYEVDHFDPTDARPFELFAVRPKTAYGR